MPRLTAALGAAVVASMIATFVVPRADAAEKIKVAVVSSLGSAPLYVADAKGYFEDEGLDAELVHFEFGAAGGGRGGGGRCRFRLHGLNRRVLHPCQ